MLTLTVIVPGFGAMRELAFAQAATVRRLLGADVETVVPDGANLADARNRGLAAAHGEWIAWADADDELDADWADLLRRIVAENASADLVAFDCWKVAADGRRTPIRWGARVGEVPRDFAVRELLRGNLPSFPATKVARRRLWEGVAFDASHARFEDYVAIPRLFARATRIVHRAELAYGYVQREGSLANDAAAAREAVDAARRRAADWRGTPFARAARTGVARDVFGLAEFALRRPDAGVGAPSRRERLALVPAVLVARVPPRFRAKWLLLAFGLAAPLRAFWRRRARADARRFGGALKQVRE